MIFFYIDKLVEYGIEKGLIEEEDRIYARNLILLEMRESNYEKSNIEESRELEEILTYLDDEAVKRGIIKDTVTERDMFDTKLMNCLMPRPSQVISIFKNKMEISPEDATGYFYNLSQNSNYIRTYRVARDKKWVVSSEYGNIDITINLSKPEKTPEEIRRAAAMKTTDYPQCLLCRENEGYGGNLNHPARNNHRIIPVRIGGEDWGFQYSPYVYYNEHCIVFCSEHIPMQIDKGTFIKLFDFVKLFPHYFVGSNADLPIVGGSILSHNHFQGGSYEFAMARAGYEIKTTIRGFEDVECGIIKWPVSVVRIRHSDSLRLVELADVILNRWRSYSDEEHNIFAETDGEKHNTVTPVARKKDRMYELDLALRNNLTTKEHPMGLFHPHEEFHHIKKENIGLIEVMGLAVLPARLKDELLMLADYMVNNKDIRSNDAIAKHYEWARMIMENYEVTAGNVMEILEKETGKVFVNILENAGVYKCTKEGRKAFLRFLDSI